MHAYRAWIAGLPDTVTSTIKLVRFPPFPQVPEPLRGRALVWRSGSCRAATWGRATSSSRRSAPPRRPTSTRSARCRRPPSASWPATPSTRCPGLGASLLLDTFTAETADAYVELAGPGADIPLVALDIRHLGGALRRPEGDPGAAGAVEAEAIVYGVGVPITEEVGAAIQATHAGVRERLAPWTAARRALLTFDEADGGLRGSFPPEVADRLARVQAAYDPDGRLLANHVAA